MYKERSMDMEAQPPGRAERPLGVAILAILAALAGILMLLASLAIASLGLLAGPAAIIPAGLGSGVLLVLALLYLLVAYGLWNGQTWAWWLSIILAAIDLVGALLALNIVTLVIAAVILWYLTRGHVKEYFNVA